VSVFFNDSIDCSLVDKIRILGSELKKIIADIYERQFNLKKIEDFAFRKFNESVKEKIALTKELIEERRISGTSVTEDELSILFSENLPYRNKHVNKPEFETNIDKRIALAKKFIKEYSNQHKEIPCEAFQAFFPLHIKLNNKDRLAIKAAIGEDRYNLFSQALPTILIVEDEDDFRHWLVSVLRRLTPNIIQANSSEDALEKIKNITKLDIKILDIALPGKSGIELLPIINKLFPDSQTIMLTAYDDIDYITTSFTNEAYDYLSPKQTFLLYYVE